MTLIRKLAANSVSKKSRSVCEQSKRVYFAVDLLVVTTPSHRGLQVVISGIFMMLPGIAFGEQLSVHIDISGCMIISGNDQPERFARTYAFLVKLSRFSAVQITA
jgi:hypothetical protein